MLDEGDDLWEEIEDAFVGSLEVQARIEAWTLELLQHVKNTEHRGFPALRMVSRETDNVGYLEDGQLRLGSKLTSRRFTALSASVYLRTWLVLSAVHGLLLLSGPRSAQPRAQGLRPAASLLPGSAGRGGGGEGQAGRVGRIAVSAGAVDAAAKTVGDARHCQLEARAACSSFQMPPRYILVVEKDAVFHTLVEERIHDRLPMIIVCGGGFPDYATRALLARLYEELRLPVAGIFDFNPAGVRVFLSYRIGSASAGLSNRMLHCPINLLGIAADDVSDPTQFRPLTDREVVLADNLLNKSPYVAGQPKLKAHIENMKRFGSAEIEAIQDTLTKASAADTGSAESESETPTTHSKASPSHPLVDLIIKKMLRRKYITL